MEIRKDEKYGVRKQVEWKKNGKIKKIKLKLKDKGKENKDKTDKKIMKNLSKKKQNWPKIKDDENN